MIRIGDFSKLSRISVKILRFYDEMNLLKLREAASRQRVQEEAEQLKRIKLPLNSRGV